MKRAHADVVVVGAGVSGLHCARLLQEQDIDVHIVEARARVGGRVFSQSVASQGQERFFDLGPSWFWPGQDRIARLTQAYDLVVFEQYAEGLSVYEDSQGRVQRTRGFASMRGSFRIEGGIGALVQAQSQRLAADALSLETRLLSAHKVGETITLTWADASTSTCKRLVLALPPRVVAETLELKYEDAPIDSKKIEAMRAIPTWMAGHAKVVAVYDTAFWRDLGLSGDAVSQRGPLAEIHDASPHKSLGALFGFVSDTPSQRRDLSDLKARSCAQLVRLFGKQAQNPIALLAKDWVQDDLTAVHLDENPLRFHPEYGLPRALEKLFDNTLFLSSTESAPTFGGFIEGALEAAERSAALIAESLQT